MAVRAQALFLLAAALAGCLGPVAGPDGGQEASVAIEFAGITTDGAWAVFDHVGGDCLAVADHQWVVLGGDGREHHSDPLVWRVDTDQPGPGGPSRWCPGQRRAFGLEGPGLSHLRIVDPDGGTVAVVAGPAPFDVSFSKDEAEDRITVAATVEEADWNRLGVRAEADGTEARIDGRPSEPVALAGGGFHRLSPSTDTIVAGDAVVLCGTSGATGTMTYTVADLWSNKVVYVTTFQAIKACG